MSSLNIYIDGNKIEATGNQTILTAASLNNIYIPSLCNDERVKIYGACGICLVELENSPRLVRACSTYITDGMVIKTNTDRIKKARKTVLELLLSNHKGDCKPPCLLACPGQTDCQGYVKLIANKQYKEAVELIKEQLPFPSSIGRICPHPCETACRRKLVEEPVSLAHLKYFASDMFLGENEFIPELNSDTGKSVAVVGGGPGGLSAAYFLRRLGHSVTVYDTMPEMGGMLRYGIPEYRLPKNILDNEISIISKMGVVFCNSTKIGEELSLDFLQSNFNAVVVAIGAWNSIGLNCPGEDLFGVWGGIDFLREVALKSTPPIGKKIAVVGGGNTAMDACRTAVRLGASEVYLVYRRTRNEMPAEDIEIAEAEEEGIIFKFLSNPIEIAGVDGSVSSIRLQRMRLGEPDVSGRRSPVPIVGEEEILFVDSVIMAIGQSPNTVGFENLALTKWNTLSVDVSSFRTNLDGVFAIGDAVNNGADIAISAIGEAKKAVFVIDAFLNGESVNYVEPFLVKSEPAEVDFADRVKSPRVMMRHVAPAVRKSNFNEINFGFCESEAVIEASRCLECGCSDFFECELIRLAHVYPVKPIKYAGEFIPHEIDVSIPGIVKNSDKCILCGLCVRVCDEVVGEGVLGLLGRGFGSVVVGADCVAEKCLVCGECVGVCPTGALGRV